MNLTKEEVVFIENNNAALSRSLEENLKKALTELLLLHLLSIKEAYVGELTAAIHDKSQGTLSVVFPYSAIYRLQQAHYIVESEKKNAPDGRRRQYYRITDSGRAYLKLLKDTYVRFSFGITQILSDGEEKHE